VTASANIPIKYFGVEEAYKEIADTYAKNKKIIEAASMASK